MCSRLPSSLCATRSNLLVSNDIVMTVAIIIQQDSPSDKGVMLKVDIEDIHQIESNDTSFCVEGNLLITKKDLKTTYETYTPIRFETI